MAEKDSNFAENQSTIMGNKDFFTNESRNTTRSKGLTPVSREVTNKDSGIVETKWLYTDNSGRVAIKQLYDSAEPFNEQGLALVRLDQGNQ